MVSMKLSAMLAMLALLALEIAERVRLLAALTTHALTPGGRNVITTTHRRLIRQARAAGMTIHAIAAALGVAHTTVVKYSSDDTERRLNEYQRRRPLSEENREVRGRRAYARWLGLKEAAVERRVGC